MKRLAVLAALAVLLATPPAAPAALPSDPSAGSQQPLSIMRVGEAMDRLGRPLQDVPVLVADTGLDLDHPDLAGRLFSLPAPVAAPDPDDNGNPPDVSAGAPGWDLLGTPVPPNYLPYGDSDPSDADGHGTAVAGLLGAAWNNGQGGAGVAPNARFVALRTCWPSDQCYNHIQAEAFDWAAARGARVVSLSWLSSDLQFGLGTAITNNSNVLFVGIPSGNGGAADADPKTPQPCTIDAPNMLCVTTSSPTDGLDCGEYGATVVDVAVPTQNNVTTSVGGGFTGTGCATSWASPTAAGVATILFGLDPSAGPADVKAAIIDSARKVPAFEGRSVSGGVVDAKAAVELFQTRRGIPLPAAPPPPPAGPPPPPPPADTRAPAGTLVASRRQRILARRGVLVTVGCDEPCSARLTGTLSVPRSAKVYRLRGVRRSLRPGARARVRLALPRAALRPLRAALARRRRVTATVTLRVADAAGNSATRRRVVRARR